MKSLATPAKAVRNNTDTSAFSAQAIVDALMFSGVVARNHAKDCVFNLKACCHAFVAGQNKDYELVSRRAHLAADSLLTYGEMGIELGILPESATDRILSAAYAVKGRAFEHELAYRDNKLEPSQIFYDDMIPVSIFHGVHAAIDVERLDSSMVLDAKQVNQEAAYAG